MTSLPSFLPGVDDVGSDVAGADALPDRLLAGADVLRRSAAALAALTEKQRMRALAGLALCWRDPEDEFRREALERLRNAAQQRFCFTIGHSAIEPGMNG